MSNISFGFNKNLSKYDSKVFFVAGKDQMEKELKKLNEGGDIIKAINNHNPFEGNLGDVVHLIAPRFIEAKNVFIFSLGAIDKLNKISLQKLGGIITSVLSSNKIVSAELFLNDLESFLKGDIQPISSLLLGIQLRLYAFNKYFEFKKDSNKTFLTEIICNFHDEAILSAYFEDIKSVSEGVKIARDFVSEPANVLNPDEFKNRCLSLSSLGVKVKVLDYKQMKELGMGALLGVSQGSSSEPYVVVMEWKPKGCKESALALVGKGVCFDSGGINLKPSAGMGDMKYDMAGAAAVVGAMHTISARRSKAHVVGIVGLVENMPSGNAQRPSDVVRSMSGQTIEIGNTDAEGRLVLADIMHYVQDEYSVSHMIDLATLTGAIVVALGETYAGLFSNDDALVNNLCESGECVGELLWRMPLHPDYDKQIDSSIADISNTGSGKGAGSCTAAHFLNRFVKDGCFWAHIDIAGMAWNKSDTVLSPRGATGFGVRLLNEFVKNYME